MELNLKKAQQALSKFTFQIWRKMFYWTERCELDHRSKRGVFVIKSVKYRPYWERVFLRISRKPKSARFYFKKSLKAYGSKDKNVFQAILTLGNFFCLGSIFLKRKFSAFHSVVTFCSRGSRAWENR